MIAYFKTECPGCSGPIEFPSDAYGQPINCPHCALGFCLPLGNAWRKWIDRLVSLWRAARELLWPIPREAWLIFLGGVALCLLLWFCGWAVKAIGPEHIKRIIGDVVGPLILIVLFVFIYFLPFITARVRKHRNLEAIGVLNFFLGWTFVFWVLALVWSVYREREK
jgi:hypothetical protein